MKKLTLKKEIKQGLIAISLLTVVFVSATLLNTSKKEVSNNEKFTYVNDYIFDSYYPVVNNDEKVIRPYNSNEVSIYKKFYDKDSSNEEQQNSIIYHENIYMQNSGVDYKSDNEFDVLSSLSGTVTNIVDDPLLGKTIEVRNSTELIITYQSLNEVSVKKGDVITQGQIIGKSGTCVINPEIKYGLHVEMYKNGSVINPEKYYDKSIKELSSE